MQTALEQLHSQGLYRSLPQTRAKIDFASNDYLGFSLMKLKSHDASGSTGSRLISGNHPLIQSFEEKMASDYGYEAALLFPSGYIANLSLFSTVIGENDLLFYDHLAHASLHDGIRLGKGRAIPYRHRDMNQLEERLKRYESKGKRYLYAEAVYSTNGSIAPLQELQEMANRYHVSLIIDEAHSFGLFGDLGKGLSYPYSPFALLLPFGKALGCSGAFLLCSALVKEWLVNQARPLIYSTAPSPQFVATMQHHYEALAHAEEKRKHLRKMARLFGSTTPLFNIPITGAHKVMQAKAAFQKRGIEVAALRYPTVKKGKEALKIVLHAFNTSEECHQLMEALHDIL